MKIIEVSNLGEKALPDSPSDLVSTLKHLRTLIQTHTQSQEQQKLEDAMHTDSNDEEIQKALQNLVENKEWNKSKLKLLDIGDIFNFLGAKIESWKQIPVTSQLLLFLKAQLVIAQNCSWESTLKFDYKAIQEIMKSGEDLEVILLAMELAEVVTPKKLINGILEKTMMQGLGGNLLQEGTKYFSLIETLKGENKHGVPLIRDKIEVVYESTGMNLNERASQQISEVTIERLTKSGTSVAELTLEIAKECGKELDKKFMMAVENLVLWNRFLVKEKNPWVAVKFRLYAIYQTVQFAEEIYLEDYQRYMKEHFLPEIIDLILHYPNKEYQTKATAMLYKILAKDMSAKQLIPLDMLINPPRVQEGQVPEISVLMQILKDISGVKMQEEGILVVKECFPVIISKDLAESSEFQYHFLGIVSLISRRIAQQSRDSEQNAEIFSLLIKMSEEIPLDSTYCYNFKVIIQAMNILKGMLKPRHEEQMDLVNRIVKKLDYELNNYEKEFKYSQDEDYNPEPLQAERQKMIRGFLGILQELIQKDSINTVGIARKVYESKTLEKIEKIIVMNNESKGELIEHFFSKCTIHDLVDSLSLVINILSYVSNSMPENIPHLIKAGIIPSLLSSLQTRIPPQYECYLAIIFALTAISLNQEGLELVKESSLFVKVLEAVMKDAQIVYAEQNYTHLRTQICYYLDRNAEFRVNVKNFLQTLLISMKAEALTQLQQTITLRRSYQQYSELQEHQTKLKDQLKQSKVYQGLFLVSILTNLSIERTQTHRHTLEMFQGDEYRMIKEVFEVVSESGVLSTLYNPFFSKIFKILTEQSTYLPNMTDFINSLKQSITSLKTHFSAPFSHTKTLSSILDISLDNKQPIETYSILNKEECLSTFERFVQSKELVNNYVKMFGQYFGSATKYVVVTSFEFYDELKILQLINNAFNNDKSALISAQLQALSTQEEPTDPSQQALKQELFLMKPSSDSKQPTPESISKIQSFFEVIQNNLQMQIMQEVVNDMSLYEFIQKLQTATMHQSRHGRAQPRSDAEKKMYVGAGKLIKKLTNAFKQKNLASLPQDPLSSLTAPLLSISNRLSSIRIAFKNYTATTMMEGEAFYEFFKTGGLSNLTDLFQFMVKQCDLIKKLEGVPMWFDVLWEECCLKLKDVLVTVIEFRNLDASQTHFLQINMTNEFDNLRHFFANVYYHLLTNLLPPSQEPPRNPLLTLYTESKHSHLQEIVVKLLANAASGFSGCPYLKEGQSQARAYNRGRNVDQNSVNILVEMGFQVEQVRQVLQQTSDIDRAMNILIEQAAQQQYDFDMGGRVSSDESMDEDSKSQEKGLFHFIQKIDKVSFDDFKNKESKVVQMGLLWILDAQEQGKVQKQMVQQYVMNLIANEKVSQKQREIFTRIYQLFIHSTTQFKQNVLIVDEDLDMSGQQQIQTESKNDKQSAQKMMNDIQLMLKVILKDMQYAKQAIMSGLFTESLSIVKQIAQCLSQPVFIAKLQKESMPQLPCILTDYILIFLIIQNVAQSSITKYSAEKQRIEGKPDCDMTRLTICNKKIAEYSSKIDIPGVVNVLYPLIDRFIEQKARTKQNQPEILKPQLLLVIVGALVSLLSEHQLEHKDLKIQSLYEKLGQLDNSLNMDSKLLQQFILLGLDLQKVNEQVFEKIIERVLFMKYEDSNKRNKDKKMSEIDLSAVPYKSFSQYFKMLKLLDKESYAKATQQICEMKIEKKNEKLVNESAQVRFKEKHFQEIQKYILKERAYVKQLFKTLDFSDKHHKSLVKQAKRSLSSMISPSSKASFQQILLNLNTQVQESLTELSQFFSGEKVPATSPSNQAAINKNLKAIEILSKLSVAHPAIVLIFQEKILPNKQRFSNWFIQDFLFQMLIKKVVKNKPGINANAGGENANAEDKIVEFEIKEDTSAILQQTSIILNSLTGYNHFMTQNEITVKYDMRVKFVQEALQILSKILITKNAVNPLKQRGLIIACLIVIEVLTNAKYAEENQKKVPISTDNYVNALRVLVLKEVKHTKTSQWHFLKMLSDLLHEKLDLNSKLNSEILTRSISILKILADFVSLQNKKRKLKLLNKNYGEEEVKLGENVEKKEGGDVVMSQSDEEVSVGEEAEVEEDEEDDDDEEFEDNEEGIGNQLEQYDDIDGEDVDDEEIADNDAEQIEGPIQEMEINMPDDEENFSVYDEELGLGLDMEFQDENMDESDEDELEERRQHNNFDIVNVHERDMMQFLNSRMDGSRRFLVDRAGQRQQVDWSVEEQQVQQLLMNLRGMNAGPLMRRPGGEIRPLGRGRDRQQQNPNDNKFNIVESIFEPLKTMTLTDLLDLITRQKQVLTKDAELIEAPAINDLVQPAMRRNDGRPQMYQHIPVFNDRGDEDRNVWAHQFVRRMIEREGDGLDDVNPIHLIPHGGHGIDFMRAPFDMFQDPMFARPPPNPALAQDYENPQSQVELQQFQHLIRNTQQIEEITDPLFETLERVVTVQEQSERVERRRSGEAEEPLASPRYAAGLDMNAIDEEMRNQFRLSQAEADLIAQSFMMLNQQQHQQPNPPSQQVPSSNSENNQENQASEVREEERKQEVEVRQEEVKQEPIEEVKERNEEVNMEENNNPENVGEEQKQENQAEANQPSSEQTFGYDNEVLLANGIEPSILAELPEDMRAELLSSVDVNILGPRPNAEQREENKNNEQQEAQQQQQQQQQQQPDPNEPEYMRQARELGIDPTFLENIPEEYRREIIQNEQRQRQAQAQAQRQPEEMDLASVIASVTDPRLRQEMFANLDEVQLNSLPADLLAQARMYNQQSRAQQRLLQDNENMFHLGRNVRNMQEHLHHIERRYRDQHELFMNQNNQDQGLDQVVLRRLREIAEDCEQEDVDMQLVGQLNADERIIETLVNVLCANENAECELIPTIQSLLKVPTTTSQLSIRNKFLNAFTFILKLLSQHDDESLFTFVPIQNPNKKKLTLIIIGTLRILIKNNKKLMKHILRSLVNKEEYFKSQGATVLKKQQKLMQNKGYQNLPPLMEILNLLRTDFFRSDKALLSNLTLLIHQTIKSFDSIFEEFGQHQSPQISAETIESLGEILQLDTIDINLLNSLGEFLFQISRKCKQNFELIFAYCKDKCYTLIEKLNCRLCDVLCNFKHLKMKLSPFKSVSGAEQNYSPAQSVYSEEEKSDMQIDTSSANLQQKVKQLKLSDEEEKSLKSSLKIQEDSETLIRIFRLYNLFYQKFKPLSEVEKKEEELNSVAPNDVVNRITEFYAGEQLKLFEEQICDLLRIVQSAGVEVNEGVSNVIFCVFSSFFPEVFDLMSKAESEKEQPEENEEEAKIGRQQPKQFKVNMQPLKDTLQQSKTDQFLLFKNVTDYPARLNTLNKFCLINRRIINKLIKQRNNLFVTELDGLIKHIPNLLDFENKRVYFKNEIGKLKRNQYYDQIQLVVRRDHIFMDAFEQMKLLPKEHLKNKLHIQFQGERGQDAGGLTREFYTELSKQMFNPLYSLFILSSSGSTYYPNPQSGHVDKEHLKYFKFIGRIIGKALLDDCLLECYFVKSLYKIITGEALIFYDLEDFDHQFYQNLKWCLENDVTGLQMTFLVELDYFGRSELVELLPGGDKIEVNNQNKMDYVEKLCYYKLYQCIQKQVDSFLEGFYEMIPKELIQIFNYKELELLISGLPTFDLNDLRQNLDLSGGYTMASPQIQWMFEILETFDNSERAEFLQFVTGSSKIPMGGFKELQGMRGPQKLTIQKFKCDDPFRLPAGHTCFNQLDLPEYPSKEIMHERLLTAIKETKGFGFA